MQVGVGAQNSAQGEGEGRASASYGSLPGSDASSIPVHGSSASVEHAQQHEAHKKHTAAAYAKGAGRGGRLHFVKFETSRVEDAVDFIKRKRLHCVQSKDPAESQRPVQVRII